MHIYIHMYINISLYACIHIHVYIPINIHVCLCICIRIRVYSLNVVLASKQLAPHDLVLTGITPRACARSARPTAACFMGMLTGVPFRPCSPFLMSRLVSATLVSFIFAPAGRVDFESALLALVATFELL